MYKLICVTGGVGGDSHLIIGSQQTALVDTGMAYCGSQVVANITAALAQFCPHHPQLDYIFLTHSHYDHLGALPYLRQAWPQALICGAAHAQKILQRPNALKAIRRLSEGAAQLFGSGKIQPYEDHLLQIQRCLQEGDILDLGCCPVETIETPGHTQCSLSFLVDGNLIFGSESTGYTSKCGRVNTTYVNSYWQAIQSIHKCAALQAAQIISPHYGLLNPQQAACYWDKCLAAAQYSKDFILAQAQAGCHEAEILEAYFQEFYDEICKNEQPYRAWRLNSLAAIRTVLKEFAPPH